jgi:cytochrome d ubiquinol oxidase subunit I
MIASTLAMYLALYAVLTLAYVTVLFHLARKAGHATTAEPLYPSPALSAPPSPATEPVSARHA